VLPGGRAGKPLSNMAFLTLLRRMNRRTVTAHGFRSTFKDWATECTSFPNEVSEMALGHAIGTRSRPHTGVAICSRSGVN
jgi:integrase